MRVWFSFKDPDEYGQKREKIDLSDLIKDTAANRDNALEIKRLRRAAEVLEKELEGFT